MRDRVLKNIYGAVLLMAVAFFTILSHDAQAAPTTFTYNSDGTVQVDYTVKEGTTILIMVENTDTDSEPVKYYYKLETGDNNVRVPLTEGAGTYKLRLCKVLAGNRAMLIKSWSTQVNEEEAKAVFANSSMVVNYEISEEALKKADSLTKNCKTEADKVKKIYDYVVKNFSYDYELLETKSNTSYYLPSINNTFDRKLGICYDISSVIAGMLRYVGVDAAIATGYTPNVAVYHAWNKIYDSQKGTWYTVDGTYDMCKYDSGTKKYTMKKKDADYSDIVYHY